MFFLKPFNYFIFIIEKYFQTQRKDLIVFNLTSNAQMLKRNSLLFWSLKYFARLNCPIKECCNKNKIVYARDK